MSTYDSSGNEMCKMAADLSQLYSSGLYSDLTILVNGEKFKVHKAVLSCRCTVFAAMLSGDFVESKTNIIMVDDIDTSVMKNLLRYIYSGDVEDLPKTYEGLLSAADKYGLAELTEICEEKMALCLDPDNAARYLLLSDRHNAKKLKTTTVDFIGRNSNAVHSSKSWMDLKETSSKLIVETLCESFPTENSNILSTSDRKFYAADFMWEIPDFSRLWEEGTGGYGPLYTPLDAPGTEWQLRLTPVSGNGTGGSMEYATVGLALVQSPTYPVFATVSVYLMNACSEKAFSVHGTRMAFSYQLCNWNWNLPFPISMLKKLLQNGQLQIRCKLNVGSS